MGTMNWNFFNSEIEYKQALKRSETVDGSSYKMVQTDMPLLTGNIDSFFNDWPQYQAFPFMNELKDETKGLQSDAINALVDYTLFVDGIVFIF